MFCFLAACETAVHAEADVMIPLGPRLVSNGGIPAVLAMTEKITISTAQTFTQQFYERLLTHGQVDVAANEARMLIMDETDWSVPVLFSRLSDNCLLAQSKQSGHLTTQTPQTEVTSSSNKPPTISTTSSSNFALSPNPSFAQKMALVEALLACPSMSNRHTRESIITELPSQIKGTIQHNNADNAHVMNIINACFNYDDGLDSLLQIVGFHENNSRPFQNVKNLLS